MTSQILLYHNAYNMYQIPAHEEQYICALYDKRLKKQVMTTPVSPYYAKYPKAVAGTNFQKALNQRPEYVSTCCHHMLFP